MNWLHQLIEATEELEPPERFMYWSGMACLSAVVRRNVFLDRYSYKLYPNIYVMLVAKSGLRKGVPVSIARRFVEAVKCTRVIHGRGTVQGVVKELGTAYTLEGGQKIVDASGFLISGEFDSFLIKDPDALTILTDLFDAQYNPTWKNTLKNSPIETLKNVCLVILGASNEPHLRRVINEVDVTGGFIARTFMVYEELKRGYNSLALGAPKNLHLLDALPNYLMTISKVTGEMKWDKQTRKYYDDWYNKFSRLPNTDTTGTIERVHDQILKIAMLLSLAESPSLQMEIPHIVEATDRSLECYGGTRRVSMGQGKSAMAGQTALFLKELIKAPEHKMHRRKILQKLWGEIDAIDLDRVIETVQQSGAIKIIRDGKDWLYIMSEEAVQMYTKYQAEDQI